MSSFLMQKYKNQLITKNKTLNTKYTEEKKETQKEYLKLSELSGHPSCNDFVCIYES